MFFSTGNFWANKRPKKDLLIYFMNSLLYREHKIYMMPKCKNGSSEMLMIPRKVNVLGFEETKNDGIFLVGFVIPGRITEYQEMSTLGLIRFFAARGAARAFFEDK